MLSTLAKEHGASLVRFLTRRLKNVEDAEDIAQAALLRIQRLDEGTSLDNPKAYLFQVASNLAIDSIRRNEILQRYLQTESLRSETQNAEGALSPERIIAAQQQLKKVQHAISSLPVKYRQAFLLHRKNGMSYSEIANEMGVSVSSVEKYILHALRECRHAIESEQ